MTFSIHQPNYIPFIGYFYKIASSDVFVILDKVQYPRGQSFSPRNKIKTPQGSCYLTIPVKIPKGSEGKVTYREVGFADENWKKKHLMTVEMNYKKAPYFYEIMELYRSSLLRNYSNLAELNSYLINIICNYLGIKTRLIFLSELIQTFGAKTQLIIDIGKALEADVYLSGTGGGKEYNDEGMLNENGIRLVYSSFRHPVYNQLWGEFIPNLSVLDFLFNCGPDLEKIKSGS
ncbi:MAG: WbqC family protein [Ignavibacteria bacterium]|nr:WbqC family protein [Ignavibacteria bacterium]